MANNPQRKVAGIASKPSSGLEATTTGTGCPQLATGPGSGGAKSLIRAVSFFGVDWVGTVIFGGARRTGATGVPVGRTIRTNGGSAPFSEGDALSGRGGRAMRTGSLFGSVMGGLTAG